MIRKLRAALQGWAVRRRAARRQPNPVTQMSHEEADDAYDSLLVNLDQAIAMLRIGPTDHWADWLESDATRIRAGDPKGLSHLLSAYGGMGSINDIGGPKRLSKLLSAIHTDAAALARDLDAP